ncbi:Rv1355c family protein [Dyadobacter sp. CY347]|uniref:Rv1355c family protein n=1 Tax=Dyadobacter sp. CY347 TaxID=2909336 RepID=UPI001F00C655|nr:Rv1355c family protein [Dyadobacter sp. CY347]MCF2491465.1 Rv1355c family protein [Dyadobacter sp. CY347]
MDSLTKFTEKITERLDATFKPIFFRANNEDDKKRLEVLIERNPNILIFDTIYDQLSELVKIENPSVTLSPEQSHEHLQRKLGGLTYSEYGIWVFYPWSRRLVHLLDNEEFGKVRTNRNNYIITPEEQQVLSTKKIGIIGLSIGHSVAMTLATERSVGELRLADFDLIELSNLNRIQTGTHNLGLNKSIVAARAIAEIDPFISVRIYRGGISDSNINDFLTEGGKLDLLVEVCDGLDIKVLARHRARAYKIPVIMDTSDKGMIDIERFDKDPFRPILHGLLADVDPVSLKNLSTKEKIPFVVKMIDTDKISNRLKASLIEVEQTISSWPQLGSAVALGGATTADTCRKILLETDIRSGRYYVDINKIIGVQQSGTLQSESPVSLNNPSSFDFAPFTLTVDQFDFDTIQDRVDLCEHQIQAICYAALQAPSGGNSQPCKWIVKNSTFFLFYDQDRAGGWLNVDNLGLYIALGTAIENIYIKALQLNLNSNIHYYPLGLEGQMVAAISFSHLNSDHVLQELRGLAKYIFIRNTNRNQGDRHFLPNSFYDILQGVSRSVSGCDLQIINGDEQLDELGEILSACDRVRLLTEQAHADFYKEMRWSAAEAEKTGDGVEVELLDMTVEDLVGLRVARDWNSVKLLNSWNKGRGLQKMTRESLKSASAIALISVSSTQITDFIEAGRCVERIWLCANGLGLAVQPMYTIIPLLQRTKTGDLEEFSTEIKQEIKDITSRFENIVSIGDQESAVFAFKLSVADQVHKKSSRLPFDQVFHLLSSNAQE